MQEGATIKKSTYYSYIVIFKHLMKGFNSCCIPTAVYKLDGLREKKKKTATVTANVLTNNTQRCPGITVSHFERRQRKWAESAKMLQR